jgi:hypothetical protein
MYFGSMGYLAAYLKRRYSLTIALAFSFVILANPLLLRYSTEFKHYLYEFSFASILLTSYFEILNKNQRAKFIYALSACLSIFFGISIIFVISAIFCVEMLRRLKLSFKKPFRSKWFLFHGLIFAGFLVWYIVSITPNLSFNLLNYPQIFNVDLGPGNLTNFSHWIKLLVTINSSILTPMSLLLLLSMIACIYLFLSRKITRLDFSIIAIPFVIYFLIYALNFAGKYPILLDRHSLFVLPSVYHLFVYLVYKLKTALTNRIIHSLLLIMLVGFSAGALIDFHLKGEFFFQEIKPVLKILHPTDKVFLYFSAQPGYNWYKLSLYKDLPIPLNPEVNVESGPAIPLEVMEARLPELITESGAWPAIALLTTTENYEIYANYLTEQIMQAGHSKVIVSHRSGLELRNILDEKCDFTYFEKKKGAYILDVTCP